MILRRIVHVEEPLLEFRFGQKLVYPRDGLFLYGPVDGGRPAVNYGAIGTPAGLARLERWTQALGGFMPPPAPRKALASSSHNTSRFPVSGPPLIRHGLRSRALHWLRLTAMRSPKRCIWRTATKRSRRRSICTSTRSLLPQHGEKTRRHSGLWSSRKRSTN